MFRTAYVLLTMLGIIGCPYKCMPVASAAPEVEPKASTCACCQKHKTAAPAPRGSQEKQRDDTSKKAGCCCACLCGGSLEKSPPCPVLDPWTFFTFLAADLLGDSLSGTRNSGELAAPDGLCKPVASGRDIRLSHRSLLL
jgi:hypothetical protein